MQTGYAVQRLDEQRRPYFSEVFDLCPGESMQQCRERASEWAAYNGGVVMPMGSLNETELQMELKYMAEET